MIGFERTPHPFLDLTPEEQIALIKVRDADVLSLKTLHESLQLLEAMGLIEYETTEDPNSWDYHLTDGRGTVVAKYLTVLHDVRYARRHGQQAHEPKWSALVTGFEKRAVELRAEIEMLPVNMPGTTL